MKRKLPIILLIISIFISLGLCGVAYYFYSNPKKEEVIKEVTKEAECDDTCEPELISFTGEDVNISFQYPKVWGDVEEDITSTEGGGYISGSSFTIEFTDNPYVVLYGVSSDFEISGIGDPCPILSYYGGGDDISPDTVCYMEKDDFNPEEMNVFHFECEEMDIGERSISFYYGPSATCATFGFQRKVEIHSPQEKYPGIRIVLTLIHNKHPDIVSLGDALMAVGTGESQKNFLKGLFMDIWNDVYDSLTEKDYNNIYLEIEMTEFEAFLDTIEVSE